MILREMPDLAPRPLTPTNAAFRADYYSRWGRKNTIICGRARYAAYLPHSQSLSIKLAWGGSETYVVDKRRLTVDDDAYLILNDGQISSSVLQGEREVNSFCVFFRPRMADEVFGAMHASMTRAVDDGPHISPRNACFAENLRPHDEIVTPALRQLMHDVDRGADDPHSIEESLQGLLQQMLLAEHRLRDAAGSIGAAKASTREELLRRIQVAADYICSHHAAPITLDHIAAAAALSKFHLLRLFRQVHHVSPHQFLVDKRLAAARRLLQRDELSLDDVAALAGFGTRWSLFRQLRRSTGKSASALRNAGRRAAGATTRAR